MQLAVFSDDNAANDLASLLKLLALKNNENIEIIYNDSTILSFDLIDASAKVKRILPYLPPETVVLIDVNSFQERPLRLIYRYINQVHFIAFDSGILYLLYPPSQALTYNLPIPRITESNFSRILFETLSKKSWKDFDTLEKIANYTILNLPGVTTYEDEILGSIISIDSYGNIHTNIESEFLKEFAQGQTLEIHLMGIAENLRIVNSYEQADDGSLFCLATQLGTIQVGVQRGNAARTFGLKTMDKISISRRK